MMNKNVLKIGPNSTLRGPTPFLTVKKMDSDKADTNYLALGTWKNLQLPPPPPPPPPPQRLFTYKQARCHMCSVLICVEITTFLYYIFLESGFEKNVHIIRNNFFY